MAEADAEQQDLAGELTDRRQQMPAYAGAQGPAR